jgi:hypothetical protein
LGLASDSNAQILKNYRTQATAVANSANMKLGGLVFDHKSLIVVNLESVSQALKTFQTRQLALVECLVLAQASGLLPTMSPFLDIVPRG